MTFYENLVSRILKENPDANISNLEHLKDGYNYNKVTMTFVDSLVKLLKQPDIQSIEIPQTINQINEIYPTNFTRICNIDTSQIYNFQDLENIYRVQCFIKNLTTDIWQLCSRVWQKVWGNLFENEVICEISTPEDLEPIPQETCYEFCVSYRLEQDVEVRLLVLLDEETLKLYIGAEISNTSDICSIMENTPLVENKITRNQSRFGLPLTNISEITDDTLTELRKAAQEIISYFTNHQQEVIKKIAHA